MKYQDQLHTVLQKPVFGVSDFVANGIPRPYVKQLLHRLETSGKITRIERGKYTTSEDPITVSVYLTSPCYLSMWTALSIRKLTTQLPFSVEIVTTRQRYRRTITFKGTPIVFYRVRPTMLYGYENILWKDHRVPVARPEKIIVDALYFHAIPLGELDEVFDAAEHKLLRTYAQMTGDARIIAIIKERLAC